MVEVGCAVARDDFVDKTHLCARLGFKLLYVNEFAVPVRTVGLRCERRTCRDADRGKLVPFHIQNRCGRKLRGHKSLVESSCCYNFLHKRLRNHLTALIMEGVGGENLRLERPVFVNLRREFHKVACYGCATDTLVVAFCEQAVECVTEFVEHCAHLVNAQQRRFVGCRFGEITHIHDNRTDFCPVCRNPLVADVVHPRSAAFCSARIVVGGEYSQKTSVGGVRNAEYFHIRMIFRCALNRFNANAVEFGGCRENARTDILHLEIWTGLSFVEVVFVFTHTL